MRVLFISLIVVFTDQVSKLIVKGFTFSILKIKFHGMYSGQRIPLIGDFFNITFVENPGIAFGLDFGEAFKLLISIFTIAICGLLLLYLYNNKMKSLSFRLSIAFILGGAVGNLLDRIFYGVIFGYAPLFKGKVVDFFNLRFFDFFIFNRLFGSYVFNVADVAVTIGMILFIISLRRQTAIDGVKDSGIENLLVENKE